MDLLSRLIDERKEYTNEEFRECISVIKESGRLELLQEVLGNVKEEFFVQDEIHGISHNIRVAILATYIGIQENISDEEFKLLLQAALYHDIGRKDKQKGENHGEKSAEVIEENKEVIFPELTQEEINIIKVLCVIHNSNDKIIGEIVKRRGIANVESFMKIANILKDADALDRVRLQRFGKLKPEFLRTETSKRIVDIATELYYEDISVADKNEPERLETRIETSEALYLFRALTEQNLRDRESGITIISPNSQVYYEANGEWKEYDDSSKLTLEELYKHIRMQYEHCYTNCVSLTEDPNVAKTYAEDSEQYVVVRVPKNNEEIIEKFIDARQFFIEELEKIIASVDLSNDRETHELILKIENARSNLELRGIIKDYISSLKFINKRQYLTEAKELQYHKLIAKMKLLEDRGIIGDIIPDVKNTSLLSAIGNALTSAEYVCYGEISTEMIVDCPEIFVDIFSLIGQARSNGSDAITLERLTKKILALMQSGYDVYESEDLSERDKEVLRKQKESKSDLSIEDAYEMTNGRISYSEINLQVKTIQTSAEMIIRKRIILDILKKNFPEEAEILEELLKDTQCLKSGSATKQNGRGYRVSNTVNILVSENGNDLDAKHIETLIQQLESFTEEQLEEIYIQGTNSEKLRDLLIQTRNEEERVRQYTSKTLKTQYFAEAIIEGYDWKKTGILTTKENEKLVKTITSNVTPGDLERLYNTLQSLEVDNRKLTQKEIFAIIINIAIDGNIGEVSYKELLKLSKEEQQQVLSENSNAMQTSVVPISLSLLTGGGIAAKKLKKELTDLGIPKEFIEEKDIRNVYIAKEIVEGYNWEELFGRKLESEEKKAIIQLMLKNSLLNKGTSSYLSTLISKLEAKGLSNQEQYAVIINLSINGSVSKQTGYSYTAMILGRAKVEDLELEDTDKMVTKATILKAKSETLTEYDEKILKEELINLGIPKGFIEEKDISNVYIAKEIVEGYNWEKLFGRELELEEKKIIIQLMLKNSLLNKGTSSYLSTLISKLEEKGLSKQEQYAVIINLSINGSVSKQTGYSYSAMILGCAKVEDLELEDADKTVRKSTILKAKSENLTENDKKSLEELINLGIPKGFIEEKDISNVYIAKEIVEEYNWEELLGRNLEKEEKKAIIQLILKNSSLNKGGCYLGTLISKLEGKGLSEQEQYAVIINLAINGKVSKQTEYGYVAMIEGRAKVEDLELEDADITVSEATILKAKSETLTEYDEKILKEELINLEIPKGFIEEKDISNVYIAKEIVEGYNWEKLFGRELELEEKKIIIQLMLKNSLLNKGTSSYLSTLISKLEKKGLSKQEQYAVIMNLAINRSVSKQTGYGYSAMISGQAKVEALVLEDADITISEDTIAKAKKKAEKMMKKAVNKQKGKISEIPTPGELMSGLGIEQEVVQEGATPLQTE